MAPQDEESRKDLANPCQPGTQSQVRRFRIRNFSGIINEELLFLISFR